MPWPSIHYTVVRFLKNSLAIHSLHSGQFFEKFLIVFCLFFADDDAMIFGDDESISRDASGDVDGVDSQLSTLKNPFIANSKGSDFNLNKLARFRKQTRLLISRSILCQIKNFFNFLI
jgi:hypothetical protein